MCASCRESAGPRGPGMRGHVPRYFAFPLGTLSAKDVPVVSLERPGQGVLDPEAWYSLAPATVLAGP